MKSALAIAGAAMLAVGYAFLAGGRKAKTEAKQEAALDSAKEEVRRVQHNEAERVEAVKERAEVERKVQEMKADDARDRLRNDWTQR